MDRAANKRRFLIVKRSGDMADDAKDGAELVADGRGGLTAGGGIVKARKKPGADAVNSEPAEEEKRRKPDAEDRAAEKARRKTTPEDGEDEEAEKARRPKPEDDQDEEDDEETEAQKARKPKDEDEEKRKQAETLTIPTPVKEAVLRALTEALERLMSVANRVKEAAETADQVDKPLPDEVGSEVRAVAEVLRGVGERYPSPTAKAAVAKAGARMAKDRLDRFQKAMALLAEILKELTDGKELAPTAGAAEAGVRKRDGGASPAQVPGLSELVAGIAELTRVVKRQEEELGRIRQARGVSNAIPVDGVPRREPEEVSWPFDMNRPITRDKVKKEVSFFDE
ncbi:MAG: hypothetical protein QN178_18005 [Armatimonadota bacterium]|nr:hypothetical protein [Armatimonadota bacterium]